MAKNAKPAGAPTIGNAGEVHQTASTPETRLTTNHGTPISDNQNSLKAGPRGSTLLEDFILREKIQHFDHGVSLSGSSMPAARPPTASLN